MCAAGSVHIPYQKYADDNALYTEVSTCTEGPDKCPWRTALRDELALLKIHQLKARAADHGILPEGKRSARQPWIDTIVNHECPYLRTTDCDDEWLSVDASASARHSVS